MMLDARFELQRQRFRLEAALQAPARGVTAVFGPSGSGKTTLLRCLAGLEPAARGYMRLNEETWQDDAAGIFRPVHKRALGYVFQDARLFPHLSVKSNLDYGYKRALRRSDHKPFDYIVALLGIGHLLDSYPQQLSGGEQQRVAIGRALLTQPKLLLMDEPMASLDPQRKADIMPYLQTLHGELDIPIVYVSHSLPEILKLADALILMDGGRVTATGPMHALLARLDLSPAQSEDASTVVDGVVAGHDEQYGLTELHFSGGSLSVAQQQVPPGTRLRVLIHARDVSLALSQAEDSSILNILPATVRDVRAEAGNRATVSLQIGEALLLARITRKSCERLGLRPGLPVFAQIKSVALIS